jgi:hypothetical protein
MIDLYTRPTRTHQIGGARKRGRSDGRGESNRLQPETASMRKAFE